MSGDPHFDGPYQKYDVTGKPGHYYSLWSEPSAQVNVLISKAHWGRGGIFKPGATVISQIGVITRGGSLEYDFKSPPTIDGKPFEGQQTLTKGVKARWDAEKHILTLETPAAERTFKAAGYGKKWAFMDETPVRIKDGVKRHGELISGLNPHGLHGQVFSQDRYDRYGEAGRQNGDRQRIKMSPRKHQGGGVLEGANGLSARGDRQAFNLYEVSSLHSTDDHFSRFND